MCEYIDELERFGSYHLQSDLTILELQQAADPLRRLADLSGTVTRGSVIYLIYREGDTIRHTARLRLSKQRRARQRLKAFIQSILNPMSGELEIYYFNTFSSVETTFHKLHGLIRERCDTNRIERDYQEYFIGGLTGVLKRFMLDTYTILSNNPVGIIGILFFALVTFQYLTLMDAGYPFELIDNNAIIFLNKYLLYGIALLIALPLVLTLLRTYLSTTYQPKRLGNEKFKLTFIAVFYLMLITGYAGRSILEQPMRDLFVRSYNAMHIFPRIGTDAKGEYKLIMGIKSRITYYYDLDPNNPALKQILCTETTGVQILPDDFVMRMTLRGAQYNLLGPKVIQRSNYSAHFDLLDSNRSREVFQTTYCAKHH